MGVGEGGDTVIDITYSTKEDETGLGVGLGTLETGQTKTKTKTIQYGALVEDAGLLMGVVELETVPLM